MFTTVVKVTDPDGQEYSSENCVECPEDLFGIYIQDAVHTQNIGGDYTLSSSPVLMMSTDGAAIPPITTKGVYDVEVEIKNDYGSFGTATLQVEFNGNSCSPNLYAPTDLFEVP